MVIEVSAIIPLYNKEAHISRALKSVLSQSLQNFEVIIVDDGSTDDGLKVLRRFNDPRIKVIQQENQGVSVARNRGICEAKADFIAFLDADDEWTPNHLETLMRIKRLFPEAGAFSTAYRTCQKNGIIKASNYKAIPHVPFEGLLPNYFESAALGDPPVCSSVVGIPKKIFLEMKGFQVGVWMGEDHDLWARIALIYPIAFSWETGAIVHNDALNRACDKVLPLTEEPVVKTCKAAIQNGIVPVHLLSYLKEYIAYKEIIRARKNIFADNFLEARRILKHAKTHHYISEKTFWLLVAHLPKELFHTLILLKHSISDVN